MIIKKLQENAYFIKYLIVSLTASAIYFFVPPLLANIITVAEFGDYNYYWALTGMLVSISMFGMPNHLSATRNEGELRRQFILFVHIALITSSSITVFIISLPLFNSLIISSVISLLVFSRALQNGLGVFFRVSDDFCSFLFVSLITLITAISLSLAITYLYSLNAIDYLALFISILTLLSLSILFIKTNRVIETKYLSCVDFKNLAFCAIYSGISGLVVSMDKIISKYYVGTHDYSIYVAAASLTSAMVVLFLAINQVAMPNLYDKLSCKFTKSDFRNMLKRVLLVYILAATVYGLGITVMFDTLYPAIYRPALDILPILLFASLLQGLYVINSSILIYFKKTKTLIYISIFVVILFISYINWFQSFLDVYYLALGVVISWFCLLILSFHKVEECLN